tara:strand:- start:4574 stop:5518 length:945 start_codon:yes stop_codon:yes gene_type:complete
MKFENKFVLILIASVAIYAIFLFVSDYNKILDKEFDFDLGYIFPILALVTVSWIPLILKWHLLLKENQIIVPFKKNILIWLSGSALNTTPGQLGGLIKAQLIKTLYDIPRTKTAPIVLVEKFYGLVGAIIAAIIGIIISGINFNLVLFGIGVLVVLFFFIYYRPLFEFVFSKLIKLKFFSKRSENIADSYEILRTSTKPKIASICIGLSLSYWIVISSSVYLILLAFHIDTISFVQTLSIYTSSVIIGVISFIPGGLGVTEGSLVGLFTLEGIDISLALILSVIIRLATLWYSVSVGFIGLKLTGGLSLSKDLD